MTQIRRAGALVCAAALLHAPVGAALVDVPIEAQPLETPQAAAPGALPGAEAAVALPELPALAAPAALPQLPDGVTFPAAAAPASAAPAEATLSPTRTLSDMHDSLAQPSQPGHADATLNRAFDGAPSAGAPAAAPAAAVATLTPDGRLPGGVTPRAYAARVSLEPEAGTFSGIVSIDVDVAAPTTSLVLHALDLEFTEIKVNGQALRPQDVRVDAQKETVTLVLPQALKAGKAKLELAYKGRISSQMRGLYQSRGLHRGKEEKYAFTHFEPTNARRMVPSFDEPALKATFSLTLEAPKELTLLSNMPPARREVSGDRQVVSFETTPKMSTYLLAVAAARLVPTTRRVAGVDVTVWTSPQDKKQAAFAMEVAKQALTRLNRYFGIKYQLPKLDLVSVPDFVSGAMENWGAVFFRDSAILIDGKLSSTRARRRVAITVTHEIVHQWFGNLVTMKWWNDLWLNEAFATWLSYKIVDGWKPGWKMWQEFEQAKKSPLSIDSLRSTRAISAAVSSSADIQAMFDPLTYDKGGSILRMLEGYLGEKAFRKGIRLYMRRHRYGNTEASDLWRALEEASGQPVTRLAEDWLKRPGYPIVSAKADGERGIVLSQRRFFSEPGAQDDSLWQVPVVVKYKLSGEKAPREARLVLSERSQRLSLPGRGKLEWAYANAGETGFYRVALDRDLLSSLLAAGPRALSPAERIGLLGHLWAQAKAGQRPLADFLDVLWAWRGETDRSVLEEISTYLKALHDTVASPEDLPRLADLTRALLGGQWKRLGWKPRRGEGDEALLSRAALLSAMSAVAPDDALRAQVGSAVDGYLRRPAGVDAALGSPLLAAGARFGDARRLAAYERALRAATTPERRDVLLRALGEFSDPALTRQALALTLTDAIRGQDAWRPFIVALGNPAAQDAAWGFARENWAALKEKLGPRGAAQIIGALSSLQGAGRREEVSAFFADPANAVAIAQKRLEQSLDAIAVGQRFKTQAAPQLSGWLSAPR